MEQCIKDGCNLSQWNDYDKCVLHCQKNNYQNDRRDNTLSEFYTQFILDILYTFQDSMLDNERDIYNYFSDADEDEMIRKFSEFIRNYEDEQYEEVKSLISHTTFIPTAIVFPHRDGRDYLKILNLFTKIHFDYCEFYETYLKLDNVKVFFQDCIFHNRWSISNYDILENVDNVIYQTCTFNGMVDATNDGSAPIITLDHSQFEYSCKFETGIRLSSVELEKQLFEAHQNNTMDDYAIPEINIENCTFRGKFILNNCVITEFNIHKSTFEQKFEFKNNKVESFLIDDSNFTKLVDCFKTEFKKFKIYKSIFDDFVGFEKCVFGSTRENSEHVAKFEYATFLDFTNFRNTKFLSGLDMEKINLKEYPNFLGSFIEYQNTNRETFRILKYSYDKIGNHIQANKYFSLEMKKHKVELKDKPIKGYLLMC